jgi:hypothetical protein
MRKRRKKPRKPRDVKKSNARHVTGDKLFLISQEIFGQIQSRSDSSLWTLDDSKEGMRPFFPAIARRLGVYTTSKASFHMSRSRRWRTTGIENRKEARASLDPAKMEKNEDYSVWSNEKLIERITQLEVELKSKNQRYGVFNHSCMIVVDCLQRFSCHREKELEEATTRTSIRPCKI